jgi:two-component system response regulator NreC
VRVLIIDDHAVVRAGLRLVVDRQDDMETVGEAGNAEEAVHQARLLQPDVVLLDLVMPGESGLAALPQVVAAAPGACVLVLSVEDHPRYVREAFSAGASGYVLKQAAAEEVVAAVREVAAGRRYVQPALGARVAAEARTLAAGERLSEREWDVLRLIALGHTNDEIAHRLSISVRTVEAHRAHIMQKLQISTRAELVRYAAVQGLLRDEEE